MQWQKSASKSVVGTFDKKDDNFLDNIYIDVPVNPKSGKPSGNGTNLRDYNIFAMFPEKAFDLGGNPNDPRPDYIIRPDYPLNINTKSWLIGDAKISAKTIIDDYFVVKNKEDQWQAIVNHARSYGNLFTGFFTFYSGDSSENERIRKEGFKDGVVIVILSLRTKKGIKSPL